jgi:hypothetical protein
LSNPDEPTVVKCRNTIIVGECTLHHEVVKGPLCLAFAVKDGKPVLIVAIMESGALHPLRCIQTKHIPTITGEVPE